MAKLIRKINVADLPHKDQTRLLISLINKDLSTKVKMRYNLPKKIMVVYRNWEDTYTNKVVFYLKDLLNGYVRFRSSNFELVEVYGVES